MANKVTFSVQCTPQEELTNENSGTLYVIASEVNKSLGGSGEATTGNYDLSSANQGYLNASPSYKDADDGSDVAISAEATVSFIFIKNTGFKYSTVNDLGDSYDKAILLKVNGTKIGVLNSGEAMVFKDSNATLNATQFTVKTVEKNGGTCSSGNLAVEYLVVD